MPITNKDGVETKVACLCREPLGSLHQPHHSQLQSKLQANSLAAFLRCCQELGFYHSRGTLILRESQGRVR